MGYDPLGGTEGGEGAVALYPNLNLGPVGLYWALADRLWLHVQTVVDRVQLKAPREVSKYRR